MNTLNAPIKLVWNTNDVGELCSVKIENEEMTIESNLGLLDQIPDRTYGVFIERFENDSWVPMTEVKSNLTELDANSYRVDWDAGWLWFSSEKPVGRIRATYWGRGFFLISDKRLYTEIDRNEDGSYNYESLYNLFEGIRNMRYLGEFDPEKKYKVNNQVFYQGSAYIKTEDSASEGDMPPREDIANWDLLAVGFNPMGAYNESTKYYPGDIVYVESENYSNLYLCKQPVEGVNPETNDENNSWKLLFDTSFLDTKLVLDIDYSEMDMTVEDGIYRVKAGNDTGTLNGYLMVLRYDEPGVSLDGGDATIHTCRQIYFGKYIKNTDPDAAPFITSSFSIQFREGEIDEGTGNLTKEWTKVFAYQPGSTMLSNYQILGLNGRIPKERLVNPDGGFEVGDNASATGGTAIGNNSYATSGAALGFLSKAKDGGAVGDRAVNSSGFSGGAQAQCYNPELGDVSNPDTWIDAIQLGKGINSNEKTLQVYDYQMMDAEGHVPKERLKDIPLFYAPDNQLYVDSATRQMLADVNSYRFVDASPPDDTLMAFTTPSFEAYINSQKVAVSEMSVLSYNTSLYIYVVRDADLAFKLLYKPVSSGYLKTSDLEEGNQLVAAIGKVDFAIPPTPNLTFFETIQTDDPLEDFGIAVETNFPVTSKLVTSDDVLTKTNTIPYTPTGMYNPIPKKYVDDIIGTTSQGGTYVGSGASAYIDALAIGKNAKAEAKGSIQLGEGTNNVDNTFQVWDYQLLDESGRIPLDRLKNFLTLYTAPNKLVVDSETRAYLADVSNYLYCDPYGGGAPVVENPVFMFKSDEQFKGYLDGNQVIVPITGEQMPMVGYPSTTPYYLYIIRAGDGSFSFLSKLTTDGYLSVSDLEEGDQLVGAIGEVSWSDLPYASPSCTLWDRILTADPIENFGLSDSQNLPLLEEVLSYNEVLTKTNTIPYTPTMPYHPATKAYVDAHSGGGGSGGGSNRNYALHSKEDIPASRQAGDIFFIWDGFDSTTPIDPPVQNMQAVQYTNMVISVDEPENAEYWGKIVSESKEGTSDIPVSDIVSGDMEVAEEPSGTKIFFNKIK